MTEQEPEPIFVYEHNARRLELIVRIGYWIGMGIVTRIYSILAIICQVIHWFFILIMGRRQQGLSDFAGGYFECIVSRIPRINFMTDTRPDVVPGPVRIFMANSEKS